LNVAAQKNRAIGNLTVIRYIVHGDVGLLAGFNGTESVLTAHCEAALIVAATMASPGVIFICVQASDKRTAYSA